MHAEKVAYVERGGRVRKFGIRREKLRKTRNTCYFLQEPQGDYKLTPCQTRPSFTVTSNSSMPSKVLLFFMNSVEGRGDKPANTTVY